MSTFLAVLAAGLVVAAFVSMTTTIVKWAFGISPEAGLILVVAALAAWASASLLEDDRS